MRWPDTGGRSPLLLLLLPLLFFYHSFAFAVLLCYYALCDAITYYISNMLLLYCVSNYVLFLYYVLDVLSYSHVHRLGGVSISALAWMC